MKIEAENIKIQLIGLPGNKRVKQNEVGKVKHADQIVEAKLHFVLLALLAFTTEEDILLAALSWKML